MKLPRRILFVGAHCDDIELFAGGLLSLACRNGHEVGVLVFSDHRGIVPPETADRAKAEFDTNIAELAQMPGAKLRDHSGQMLRACSGEFESERAIIYKSLEQLRDSYDLVVSHARSDTNQDHQQVATEVARVFKSACSIIAGEFPNNDLGQFTADVHVALAEQDVDAKVRMLARYESQMFDGRPYFAERVVRGLAAVRGSQIRTEHAEAFSVVRLRVD